jgi:RLL motif-containing protein 1
MFLRKLLAIGYPGISQFSINDEASIRDLVIWLEDNVFYTDFSPEFMSQLHNVKDPEWNRVFKEYLNECSCPFDAMTERTSCVDWLLREAIRLVVDDPNTSPLMYLNVAQVEAASKPSKNQINLDVESQAARDGINKMAEVLHMTRHPNPNITFQAIASLLSKNPNKKRKENIDQSAVVSLPLEKVTLGFDTRDKSLNDVCKIVRLLHLRNLRQLQTQIDSAMVSAQSITADPKTDQTLGKTGF